MVTAGSADSVVYLVTADIRLRVQVRPVTADTVGILLLAQGYQDFRDLAGHSQVFLDTLEFLGIAVFRGSADFRGTDAPDIPDTVESRDFLAFVEAEFRGTQDSPVPQERPPLVGIQGSQEEADIQDFAVFPATLDSAVIRDSPVTLENQGTRVTAVILAIRHPDIQDSQEADAQVTQDFVEQGRAGSQASVENQVTQGLAVPEYQGIQDFLVSVVDQDSADTRVSAENQATRDTVDYLATPATVVDRVIQVFQVTPDLDCLDTLDFRV